MIDITKLRLVADGFCQRIYTDEGDLVARIPYTGSHSTNAERAQLICALPDLAVALLGVLRVADRKTDEFDAARAALRKAGLLPDEPAAVTDSEGGEA